MTTFTFVSRALLGSALCGVSATAYAEVVIVPLRSFQEVPAVSSPAKGRFRGFIDDRAGTLTYELSYDALQGEVRQAHIHFGQRGVNGGVSVFLCQTASNPDPTGLAPTCGPAPSRVSGTLRMDNVIGPAGQGIAPAEFAELVAAIRAGVAYVNVHSSLYPAGEVRGQMRGSGHEGRDDH